MNIQQFTSMLMRENSGVENLDFVIVKRNILQYDVVVENLVNILSSKTRQTTVYIVRETTRDYLTLSDREIDLAICGYFKAYAYNGREAQLHVAYFDGTYNPNSYQLVVTETKIEGDIFPSYVSHIQRELMNKVL